MNEAEHRWTKRLDPIVVVAVLAVILVIVLEQAHVGHSWKTFASALN
jgi:hypothetical protein